MGLEHSVESRTQAWETALENEGLVNKAAGQYILKFDPRSGIDFDFLKSFAWEGLLLAAERFDPDRGFAFSTFAVPYIRGFMQRGVHLYLRQVGGSRSDSDRRAFPKHQSLDDPDNEGLKNHVETSLVGDEEEDDSELFEDLYEAIQVLEEPGRTMLRLHYFGDGKHRPGNLKTRPGMTFQEIGNRYGLTRERIRQRVSEAINRLQAEMAARRARTEDLENAVYGEKPW